MSYFLIGGDVRFWSSGSLSSSEDTCRIFIARTISVESQRKRAGKGSGLRPAVVKKIARYISVKQFFEWPAGIIVGSYTLRGGSNNPRNGVWRLNSEVIGRKDSRQAFMVVLSILTKFHLQLNSVRRRSAPRGGVANTMRCEDMLQSVFDCMPV